MLLIGRQSIMNRFIIEQNMINAVFWVMVSGVVVAVIKRHKKRDAEEKNQTKRCR